MSKSTKISTNRHYYNQIIVGVMSLLSVILLLMSYGIYDKAGGPLHIHNPHKYRQLPATMATPPKPTPTIPDTTMPPTVDGMAPVIYTLPTDKPVVFLTIDDGGSKTTDELPMMRANHLTASLFLARLFIDENPGFFKDFMAAGNQIENHTVSHNLNMIQMSYEQQKQEICDMADYEQQQFGRRPTLFRPPGGAYSDLMRRAAADCGMKGVVTWIAKANGGSMQYQIGDHLRPGDIVLMHFRPEFKQDLQAFLDAMHSQHLHTELLENWLQ
jgi:peptidoglycan/xylan/chitin deacetylase (PgdA/CDA1 family)